nr:PREDICTED: ATPase family AAA domain-containing protein 2-like [Latimeria chalumnae]|eukprot:XP_014350681.1 PREDICTED: ATPase family AAA domain-containing protein 2-like [Latimeria chalumnae]
MFNCPSAKVVFPKTMALEQVQVKKAAPGFQYFQAQCLPLNFRKDELKGIHKDRMKIGASLADVDPMQIDTSVKFDSIGGLSSHIATLKEMIVFPLLYPEVFERFKIQPPRGCLFYGPPGTGKTLVARALANECSQGDRRVAFFMRKGADCLSKWVGESERQLRLLFDQVIVRFFSFSSVDPRLGKLLGLCGVLEAYKATGEQWLHSLKVHSSMSLALSWAAREEAFALVFLQSRNAHHQPTSYRPRLLLAGKAGSGQSSHLAPALIHTLEKFSVYSLDLPVLYGVSTTSPEETCAQLFLEAKRTAPSILYIPHVHTWWETVGCALKATFVTLLQDIPSFMPILFLATCDVPHKELPEEVQELFIGDYGEVFHVQLPNHEERRKFFEDLILHQAARPPSSKKKAVLQALEVLPVAPPPEPRQLTAEELKRLEEQEENTLRELRLFLRDVTHRLAIDKRFKAFTKPVDPEEVPDYCTVIKLPMDLSTVISKIDLHKYMTVKEYLKDIDLICSNALEYNPDRDPADRLIRHRACTLKDAAYAIIKEDLDEEFEKLCEEIEKSQKRRGCGSSKFAPSYYHVLPKQMATTGKIPETENMDKTETPVAESTPLQTLSKKRSRRKTSWSCGTIKKRKKIFHTIKDDDGEAESEDYGEGFESIGSSVNKAEGEFNGDSLTETESDQLLQDKQTGNTEEAGSSTGWVDAQPNVNAPETVIEKETACAKLGGNGVGVGKTSKHQEIENAEEHEVNKDVCITPMTRARRSQVQQQQLINVEKAMEILLEPTPTLFVDNEKLKNLLKRITEKSEGFTVFHLEKLYALLAQCIYRHRKAYDKTKLIQEMEGEVENFS